MGWTGPEYLKAGVDLCLSVDIGGLFLVVVFWVRHDQLFS